MSSPIKIESRTLASLTTVPFSWSSSQLFLSSEISSRRYFSVAQTAGNFLFVALIVLIHASHRFALTDAAFTSNKGASSSQIHFNIEARGSNIFPYKNAFDSGNAGYPIKTEKRRSDVSWDASLHRAGKEATNGDIEHEIIEGLKISRANDIVGHETINCDAKDPKTFSSRGDDPPPKYLEEHWPEKPKPKPSEEEISSFTMGQSGESDFLIPKYDRARAKRIISSRNDELPSSDVSEKLSVASEGSRENDVESTLTSRIESWTVKTTYKPAPAVTQPFEKYDRRHFGPPRLENVEEFSKVVSTSEVEPRSSSTVPSTFQHLESSASPINTISSTSSSSLSTSSLSSSTLSTKYFDDTHRANENGEVVAEEKDHDDEEDNRDVVGSKKSKVTLVEKFDGDAETPVNEDYVSPIDPSVIDKLEKQEMDNPDRESRIIVPLSTIAGIDFEQRPFSTVITEPSNNENFDDLTAGPSRSDASRDGIDVNEAVETARIASRNELVDKLELTILGLFELTKGNEPRPEGPSELQAARIAVDRINEMNILTNIRLRLIHNDTKTAPTPLLYTS